MLGIVEILSQPQYPGLELIGSSSNYINGSYLMQEHQPILRKINREQLLDGQNEKNASKSKGYAKNLGKSYFLCILGLMIRALLKNSCLHLCGEYHIDIYMDNITDLEMI